MTTTSAVATRSAYRDLLSDLLRRTVTVTVGGPQHLGTEQVAYLATYRDEDDDIVTVLVLDLSLATALAAALGTAPPWQTRRRVEEEGRLDDELHDCLHEVCNVLGRLQNDPGGPRVRLTAVPQIPGGVTHDVAQLVSRPRVREDWHVEVQGYGDGLLTVLGR